MNVDPKQWLQVVSDLRTYYETDLDNCKMQHDDWIRELAFAVLDKNYDVDFYKRFNAYMAIREE